MSDVSTTSSGMTGAGGGNLLRITGMATGLDVDAIVKKMMTAEQTKLDKAKQDQQYTAWKQEAYQDIIKDIKDLQSSFFDSTSSDKNILSSTNFAPFTVSGAGGASTVDTSVAAFTPGVGAQAGNYKITVTSLAAGAGLSNTLSGNTLSTKLSALNLGTLTGTVRLSLNTGGNDVNITLDNSNGNATIGDLVSAINNQAGGTVKASFSELTGKFKLNTVQTGASTTLKINAGTTSALKNLFGNGSGNDAFTTGGAATTSDITVSSGASLNNKVFASSTTPKLTDIDSTLTGNVQLVLGSRTVTLDNSSGTKTLNDLITAINTDIPAGGASASFDNITKTISLTADSSADDSVKSGTSAGIYSILGLTGTTSDISIAKGTALTNNVALNDSIMLTDVDSSLNTNITMVLNAGGSDFTVNLDNTGGGKTVSDLINSINTAAGSTIASFDDTTKTISLKQTSSSGSLTIKSGTNSAALGVFGLYGLTTGNGVSQSGSNADVTITDPSGTSVHFKDVGGDQPGKQTNNFTIDGMTYTLSSTGSAEVNVGLDTQKVYDKIKGFIDKYNSIVDEIQTKLIEKPDSNYKPLTDAQKATMSESQITAWETKAKVGILRNDDNLSNLLNSLRTAFTTGVNNAGFSIGKYGSNSIGLDTSTDYDKPAHIDIVDSGQLKAAISTNADQILKMFTNVSDATDGKTNYNSGTQEYQEDGIFTRIKSILQTNVGYTNTTLNTAILTSYANKQYDYSSTGTGGEGTLPDQLYEQQLMITKLTSAMSDKQEKYYQQFSQLETAMTQLNSQQSMLSSMLSG